MTLKKYISSAYLACSVFLIAACGGESTTQAPAGEQKSAQEITHIRVGVCPGPYGKMVEEGISPYLKKKNIEVEIVEFADYIQPDVALESRDIDANLMQHVVYLASISKNLDLKGLVAVITVPTLGTAIFSDKYKSFDELQPGDKVILPADAVVTARNLRFARDVGLITLKRESDDAKASLDDVDENKYGVEFAVMDSPQIARTLDSVAIGFVPGNYAIAAGLDFDDALAIEKLSENFKNSIVVREDNFDTVGQLLKEAVESEDFRKAIDGNDYFKGFERPEWWGK